MLRRSMKNSLRVISNRELRRIAAVAERQGWVITRTGGGHLKWKSPDGQVVITAATPDDSRGIANSKAFLRKAGLVLDR